MVKMCSIVRIVFLNLYLQLSLKYKFQGYFTSAVRDIIER